MEIEEVEQYTYHHLNPVLFVLLTQIISLETHT